MNIFRSLLQIGLLSFIVGCCAGANLSTDISHPKVNSPPPTELEAKSKRIKFINGATVALVTPVSDSFFIASCTGVWVSKGLLLTAAHCVDDDSAPVFRYATEKDFEKMQARPALLIARSKEKDLALLVTDPSTRPEHEIAAIEESSVPSTGDVVDIVGHPVGYTWTYTRGYVSAIRDNAKGPLTTEMKILQISAPIWMGNSGGGAFNEKGNLIGICSWISKNGPQLAFFIHIDEIKTFLHNEALKIQP